MQKYRVERPYYAPNLIDIRKGDKVRYRLFKANEEFIGIEEKVVNQRRLKFEHCVLAEKQWALPKSYVEYVEEAPNVVYARGVEDRFSSLAGSKLSDKDRTRLNRTKSYITDFVAADPKTAGARFKQSAKTITTSMGIGLALGVLTGLHFKKNLWLTGSIGTLVGGLIGVQIDKAKTKEESHE